MLYGTKSLFLEKKKKGRKTSRASEIRSIVDGKNINLNLKTLVKTEKLKKPVNLEGRKRTR